VSKESDLSPKILMVNFHSTMNAGDLGLLICAREFLLRVFPSCELSVSANWPDEPAYQENGFTVVPSPWSLSGVNIESSNLRHLGKYFLVGAKLFNTNINHTFLDYDTNCLRTAYKETDIIVSVPGNQFYSSGRFGWPFPISATGLLLAQRYKKPLVVLPQSIGPLKRCWEKKLIRKAYGSAKRVFIRDENSLELVRTIGLPAGKVRYTPDLALGLQPGDYFRTLEVLQEAGVNLSKPKLGVTLISKMNRSFNSQEMHNYYAVLQSALAYFAREHFVQIVFFNQVTGPTKVEDDRIPTTRMANSLQGIGIDVIHVDKSLPPALLKSCFGQMDAFLATRLHSGIYAIGMTVPTLFIGYLTKTQGIVRSLRIEDDFIDIADLSVERLRYKLDILWMNRIGKCNALSKILVKAQQQIEESIELLKQDFSNE